jgi:hypothetical protein
MTWDSIRISSSTYYEAVEQVLSTSKAATTVGAACDERSSVDQYCNFISNQSNPAGYIAQL